MEAHERLPMTPHRAPEVALPCPFGGDVSVAPMIAGPVKQWCIVCTCGLETGLYDSREELLRWWNSRPRERSIAEAAWKAGLAANNNYVNDWVMNERRVEHYEVVMKLDLAAILGGEAR
jgi:hypothetical protein